MRPAVYLWTFNDGTLIVKNGGILHSPRRQKAPSSFVAFSGVDLHFCLLASGFFASSFFSFASLSTWLMRLLNRNFLLRHSVRTACGQSVERRPRAGDQAETAAGEETDDWAICDEDIWGERAPRGGDADGGFGLPLSVTELESVSPRA